MPRVVNSSVTRIGPAWHSLPSATRAKAVRLGRAGVAPADIEVQDAMIARHHARLRGSRCRSWLFVGLVAALMAAMWPVGDPLTRARTSTLLAVVGAAAIVVVVLLGGELSAMRWARVTAAARVAAALRDPVDAAPVCGRQRGLASPDIAFVVFGVPFGYLVLLLWSVHTERALHAAALPGEPFDWGTVRGLAILWAFVVAVPGVIGFWHAYRLRPFDRSPAVRVDGDGVWVRRLRATVPWSQVLAVHAAGPTSRDGSGLALQLRDPDAIVASSAYPRIVRRYALWGLRGGQRWIVVDERLLREPADRLLTAALAYHGKYPPPTEFAPGGAWAW